MKIKRLIFRFSIVFILITVVGFTLLTGSEADNQVSINNIPMNYTGLQGCTASTDGPFVMLTTKDEIQKLYDSMDTIGEYTYTIPTYVVFPDTNDVQEPLAVTITANIDELRKWELSFEYIVINDKKQLVTNGANYSVTDIPGKDEYVISYNNVLLLLNIDTETLKMYTSPKVGKYSYTDTKTSDGVEHSVLWASNPSFNKSGTKMIYYSERASIEEGRIWVLDTLTGEEKPVQNTGGFINVLEWYNDETVYVLSVSKVIEICVESLTAKVIYEHDVNGLMQVGFAYPYLFIPKSGGSRIIDLSNGNITPFGDTQYAYFKAVQPGNGYDTLLVYQTPNDDNGYYSEAVVLNMQTSKKCVITVAKEDTICGFRMYDEDTIIMNVAINSDSYNQITYLIPYSELKMD